MKKQLKVKSKRLKVEGGKVKTVPNLSPFTFHLSPSGVSL